MPRRQLARQAGHFFKHVVPAAVKPVHSLWHEVIGFLFSTIAVWCSWKLWRNAASQAPVMLVLEVFFIIVMAGYGISSFLKARRISRS